MNKFLETENLVLSPIEEAHCTEAYVNWLNDPEVNRYLESGLFPTNIEGLKQFVNNVAPSTIFLAILLKDSGKHIGNIKIDQISHVHKRGEYGMFIGDRNEWGKGYAREASEALFAHCFSKLNLNKITLGVVAGNQAAVGLYKKMGFVEEGTYRNHSFHDGKFHDVYRMALFNTH